MRRAMVASAVVGAVAVAFSISGVAVSLGASAATSVPTVTGVDTVGYPLVDLVVSGVPGLGVGPVPKVEVHQDNVLAQSSASWLLAPNEPLGVVLNVSPERLADGQALAAELVQSLPTDVPVALASGRAGSRTLPAGIDRDSYMAGVRLARPGNAGTVANAVASMADQGLQHVLILTTCKSAPPAAAPAAVRADVLTLGVSCNPGWPGYAASASGSYAAAADVTEALADLDSLVARWRSSVVVVATATSRSPLAVTVDGQTVAVPLVAAGTTASSPTPTVAAALPAQNDVAPAAGSGTGRQVSRAAFVIGLILLLVAAGLALAVRRRRRSTQPVEVEPSLEGWTHALAETSEPAETSDLAETSEPAETSDLAETSEPAETPADQAVESLPEIEPQIEPQIQPETSAPAPVVQAQSAVLVASVPEAANLAAVVTGRDPLRSFIDLRGRARRDTQNLRRVGRIHACQRVTGRRHHSPGGCLDRSGRGR